MVVNFLPLRYPVNLAIDLIRLWAFERGHVVDLQWHSKSVTRSKAYKTMFLEIRVFP